MTEKAAKNAELQTRAQANHVSGLECGLEK